MVENYFATHWPRLMAALQVVEPETPGLVGRLQGWLWFGTKKVEVEKLADESDGASPQKSMEVLNKVGCSCIDRPYCCSLFQGFNSRVIDSFISGHDRKVIFGVQFRVLK